MYQCPICKSFMKFNIEYKNGIPMIYYTCLCGYNSANQRTTTSTYTEAKPYDMRICTDASVYYNIMRSIKNKI